MITPMFGSIPCLGMFPQGSLEVCSVEEVSRVCSVEEVSRIFLVEEVPRVR